MIQNTTPLLLGDALQSAAVVCVVTHGRGQSPELMSEHIVSRLNSRGVSYVLPRAASGSWYDARAIDPLTDNTRNQLAISLEQLKQAAALAFLWSWWGSVRGLALRLNMHFILAHGAAQCLVLRAVVSEFLPTSGQTINLLDYPPI